MNTTYFVNQIMNTIFNDNTFYVGLSSTEPSVDGTGVTEPSAASYSRAELSSFSEAVSGAVSNDSEVSFGKTIQDWFVDGEKASYWLLFDGSDSSAHLLSSGELTNKSEIPYNVTVVVPAGSLKIRLFDSSDEWKAGE